MTVPRIFLRFTALVLTAWVQKGIGMSGVHLYFDFRHNCDGRALSGTHLPQFTTMKFPLEAFPLEGGYTPEVLNSNRIGSLENFRSTLNVERHRSTQWSLSLCFVLQWHGYKHLTWIIYCIFIIPLLWCVPDNGTSVSKHVAVYIYIC